MKAIHFVIIIALIGIVGAIAISFSSSSDIYCSYKDIKSVTISYDERGLVDAYWCELNIDGEKQVIDIDNYTYQALKDSFYADCKYVKFRMASNGYRISENKAKMETTKLN